MGANDSESLANLHVEDRKLLFSSMPADYSFQHLNVLKDLRQSGTISSRKMVRKCSYKAVVDFHINENTTLESGKPADFSFKKLSEPKAMGVEAARSLRTGSVPERGMTKKKLLTRSIWLNNNKLKSIKNLEVIVESILEVPSQLSWIDFSFNYIKDIDDCILKYPNLKIIYFHGNCISKISEVMKLRKLKHLRTVTFHGNPISNIPLYRVSIMHMLPQVLNLDFFPIIKNEKLTPPPTETLKIIREYEAKEKGSSN